MPPDDGAGPADDAGNGATRHPTGGVTKAVPLVLVSPLTTAQAIMETVLGMVEPLLPLSPMAHLRRPAQGVIR